MRVAMIPLDSRPPNWQFPQRLAEIAGVELLLPPRELLGTLKHGADGLQLAAWLADTVTGGNGDPTCEAVVFSWDALIYGGLVQSRDPQGKTAVINELVRELKRIDWQRVAGYSFLTVPRLGITVDTGTREYEHQLVRNYFIEWGKDEADESARQRLFELAGDLGERTIRNLWQWRQRNAELAEQAVGSAVLLGLQHCHIAVEDNAPTGPHLREVAELLKLSTTARQSAGRNWPHCTSFDGADECGCMLLAKAITAVQSLPQLQVQLLTHPVAPGADRYVGLFESHSLGEGLTFLANLLGLTYTYGQGALRWLVTHGVQPQPDVFAMPPGRVFSNPYLLPKRIEPGGPLFATDLAACNGANPLLAQHLAQLAPGAMVGCVGYNTNFNALGTTAAWLRLVGDAPQTPANRRFLLERLADDVVYQSIARPTVLHYLQTRSMDLFNFSGANKYVLGELLALVQRAWRDWSTGEGAAVLDAAGIAPPHAAAVEFSFPWSRAFEIEAHAPLS